MIEMLDPKTLTVFITGASAGFGAATCRRFAQAGARVVAAGRRADRLNALTKELGERCHPVTLDVRDRKAVEEAVADLPAGFRDLDVVVANAGLALGLQPAYEADLSDWDEMVDTNIKGLIVARDRDHVVTIGSVAADYPYAGGNVYGATKAFVKQFALNLRSDLLGKNVRVTNIEPGMAETEFSLVRFKGDSDRAKAPYKGLQPMSADDIAEMIFWTCTLPRHLNINRMQMMPVMQAFGPFQFARK
jgi:3-hydroxy acid dehydrogenase / malonic semialdehyde reductase